MHRLERKSFDAVLLDVSLPDKSGRDALVEVTALGRDHGHHNAAVSHQYPIASSCAFDPQVQCHLFLQPGADLIGDRLCLPGRTARADQKEVGEAADLPQVEDDDLGSLLVRGRLCYRLYEFRSYLFSSSARVMSLPMITVICRFSM